MKLPRAMLRKLFFLRIGKGDGEQVQETIDWGADPNWCTSRGTPAIVRAVRGINASADVVHVLLAAGADVAAPDANGLTAIDHVRRRLLKYEGKPRIKPRRSRSLSPGGELILPEREWKFMERMAEKHPSIGERFAEDYLAARRKAAEQVRDPRTQVERMLEMLESNPG